METCGTFTNTLCFVCNTAEVKTFIKPVGVEMPASSGVGVVGGGKKRLDASVLAFHKANPTVKDPGPKPVQGLRESQEAVTGRCKRDNLLEAESNSRGGRASRGTLPSS